MIKWLRREFFGWWSGFSDWVNAKDSCELCGNEWTDSIAQDVIREFAACVRAGTTKTPVFASDAEET